MLQIYAISTLQARIALKIFTCFTTILYHLYPANAYICVRKFVDACHFPSDFPPISLPLTYNYMIFFFYLCLFISNRKTQEFFAEETLVSTA